MLRHLKLTSIHTIYVIYVYGDKSADEFQTGAKNNTEILEPADPSSVGFTNKTVPIELGNESGPFICPLEARVVLPTFYLLCNNDGLCSGATWHVHLVCKETLRVVRINCWPIKVVGLQCIRSSFNQCALLFIIEFNGCYSCVGNGVFYR